MVWLRFTTPCRRTFERNLRSPFVLHGSCFGLSWLSCLRSPTLRHAVEHLVSRVRPAELRPVFRVHLFILYSHRCPHSDSWMRTFVTGIHSMTTLRRSSFLFTVDDLTPEWSSRLLLTRSRRVIFVNLFDQFVFLWFGHWNWMFSFFRMTLASSVSCRTDQLTEGRTTRDTRPSSYQTKNMSSWCTLFRHRCTPNNKTQCTYFLPSCPVHRHWLGFLVSDCLDSGRN